MISPIASFIFLHQPFLYSVFSFPVSRPPDSFRWFSLHYIKKTCQSHKILKCLKFDNFVPIHKFLKVLLTDSSTTILSVLVWFQHSWMHCQITNTLPVFLQVAGFPSSFLFSVTIPKREPCESKRQGSLPYYDYYLISCFPTRQSHDSFEQISIDHDIHGTVH